MAVWFPFTSNLGLKPEKSHFHYCLVNGDSHTVMDHDTSSPLYGLLFHHVSPMIISWGENWMQLFWRGKFTGNPHRSILQKKNCVSGFQIFMFPLYGSPSLSILGVPSRSGTGNSKSTINGDNLWDSRTINYYFGRFSSHV